MPTDAFARRMILVTWAIGVAFVLFLVANDFAVYRPDRGVSINGSVLWGRDFANVWSAGRITAEGRAEILYDVPTYQAWQAAAFNGGIADHNYSYPPVTLLYAPLLGFLPYIAAFAIWTIGSVAAFFWAARPWLADHRINPLLSIVLPSTLICVWAGHYGLFLGALWLAAWRNLDDRPRLAGVLIGLMVIKPHLAILMPLFLVWKRQWQAFAAASATVGALVLVSALAFGPELWTTYLLKTSAQQLSLVGETQTYFVKMMPTVTPAFLAYGVSSRTAIAAQVGVAALSVIAIFRFLPRQRSAQAFAFATATFLVLPYAFNYDMTVVGLAALIALYGATADGRRVEASIAALAFVLPSLVMLFNFTDFWIAPIILGLFLAIQLWRPQETGYAANGVRHG